MSKRDPIDKYIKRVWTLFAWNECFMCKEEFRRERGFSFPTGPYYGGVGVRTYMCSTCAPDAERANMIREGLGMVRPLNMPPCKPPLPPPPPPPRSVIGIL